MWYTHGSAAISRQEGCRSQGLPAGPGVVSWLLDWDLGRARRHWHCTLLPGCLRCFLRHTPQTSFYQSDCPLAPTPIALPSWQEPSLTCCPLGHAYLMCPQSRDNYLGSPFHCFKVGRQVLRRWVRQLRQAKSRLCPKQYLHTYFSYLT